MAALVLFREALAGRRVGAGAALGVTAIFAALMVPAHWTVPRAGRCLRRAPDHRSARAPSALASLPWPDGQDGPAGPGASGLPAEEEQA